MRPSQGLGGGGGIPVPLFPWNKLACSPVPQKIENLFSYVPCSPIVSLFPCSPQNLTFVPLFPWNKYPFPPVPQNPWEGLIYKLTTTLLDWINEENDRRNYFTKVWGRAGNELTTPWSAVKHAPSQTRYWLRYVARCHCLVSLKIRGHRLHGVVLPGGGGVLPLTVPLKIFLFDQSILWSKMWAYACAVWINI